MPGPPRAGDKVEWNTPQGRTTGRVVRRLTKPASVKGHKAKASPDHPQYLVESDASDKEAIHRPESLKRR